MGKETIGFRLEGDNGTSYIVGDVDGHHVKYIVLLYCENMVAKQHQHDFFMTRNQMASMCLWPPKKPISKAKLKKWHKKINTLIGSLQDCMDKAEKEKEEK